MEYQFRDIEKKWQAWWQANRVYQVSNESSRPKFYVLDMFPYPSGAGLHVGHPLGYIASDIYARFKRLKGFNVLHPMGYDAFGLPAEQYAIDHGIHPAISTEANINNFRSQLDKIGFCFDWDRQVNTSKAEYYRWTQWIFLQLFGSYFNRRSQRAESIALLTASFEAEGNQQHPIPDDSYRLPAGGTVFTANEWKGFDEKTRQDILMQYRLAYCGVGEVNWCEALGTVLANDEVVNGVSERGGHPVVRKKLRQWYLRITEYADRLLEGLSRVDFSDAMKEMQTNWIGKSFGANIRFAIAGSEDMLEVFTTRPDTIFGVDFMVIAPEHEGVPKMTTAEQSAAVEEYLHYVNSRNERERMAEKKITGVFTGAYALNPFNNRRIPIWVSEYVLAGYGTGAIMAVPCGDERDHKFARHFDIPITNIIGSAYNGEEANPTKEALLENSDFLNGMKMKDAIGVVISRVEERGIGTRKVNFKMRDAAFSRQRYWGEPIPIVWKDGIATPLPESELPLELPHVDTYKPGPEGEGPLANIKDWTDRQLETNTMPGYAGSSWYFLRYMDPANEKAFCSRQASDYWGQVDLYIGGTEHAVGHLLYSRMWTKVLFDLGFISHDEPYKRLVNQGMIQGSSRFVYRIVCDFGLDGGGEFDRTKIPSVFLSKGFADAVQNNDKAIVGFLQEELKKLFDTAIGQKSIIFDVRVTPLHVDVNIVDGIVLDVEKFLEKYPGAYFVYEEEEKIYPSTVRPGSLQYICGVETEKMSKSKFNTVNPDDLVYKFGADTFRMYEMFLGPVEMSKPWDTKGIEGVHRFLKKLWRLFYREAANGGPGEAVWTSDQPSDAEWKILHRAIRKIEDDTEKFSFNTAVSAFMIAVNELTDLKCHKKAVLEPLLVLLTPYAPHIAEELWHQLGNEGTILDAVYPKWEEKYLVESSKEYPVSINGKMRTTIQMALGIAEAEVEKIVLENEVVRKWLEGKQPKKIIYKEGKMVNVVV